MRTHMNLTTALARYGKDLMEDVELFRRIAFAIDKEPRSIIDYYNNPAISRLLGDRNSLCIERTQKLEALAYGDAGVMLACPGPSLSGLILREIGTPEQNDLFFNYIISHKAHTFLAVTEPNKGSDAGRMQAVLTQDAENPNRVWLNGEKWLVGNGAIASIGIVIARTSPGPLGIAAVMITPDELSQPGLYRTTLPLLGLRGAQLSYLAFNNFPVKKANILGRHLSPMNRGMMALIKTFNRMRPCVGALALGTAQAILDYIDLNCPRLTKSYAYHYARLATLIHVTRQLLHKAAIAVDKNPFESSLISLAKMKATQTAETLATEAFGFFGAGAFFEHPWLTKWYRDVFGFEYMEGTTNMQKKNIAQGYGHANK